MTLGLSLSAFTQFHVVLSLIGIVSGFVVMLGLLTRRRLEAWTAVFLVTTVLTSVTGFGFPFHGKLEPPHIVGIVSLVVLAIAIAARYGFHLAGGWRRTYVISAVIALYLNVFVAVVQAFQKIPALHVLAPKQSELPFVATQLAVVTLFIVMAVFASSRFRLETVHTA